MIIGLVGFAGSGKDTVADYLVTAKGFKSDAFAKPLKDAACAIFGWDREMIEGFTQESRVWREKPDSYWSDILGYDFTPRMSIQKLGTEAGQYVFGCKLWVGSLLKRIKGIDNVVITDARFGHEIKAIQDIGGILIRVKRGVEPEWYDILQDLRSRNASEELVDHLMAYYNIHKSEWDWVGYTIDYEITNDGTFTDLYTKITGIVELEQHEIIR